MQNRVELINETLTLLATYGLILFTEFVPSPDARYKVGWVIVGITGAILTLNVSVMVFTGFKEA